MSRELRGRRYIEGDPRGEWLCQQIHDIFCMDVWETADWYRIEAPLLTLKQTAFLGCNDRFFLFTNILGRRDAMHPWLFTRCREVEQDPDGYVDLWARFHYKSSIITFAGTIQEIVCDPEVKIAIFSVTKPIAQAFLSQIKDELETNEYLKSIFPDVFYMDPRRRNQKDGHPSKWGIARGITVKRKGNPKEATVEAHGLIDGQPTSRHYDLHNYDDVVTQDHLSEDAICKTTERWELADNLGSHVGVRKRMAGTRYHSLDTYGVVIERKSLKPRVYPATKNGKLNGVPVFLSQERWNQIKRDQRSTVAAQMLLDPISGAEATFQSVWLRTYDVIPRVLNVYILIDPSKGKGERSDRTAMAVIGIDQGGNRYLLDGFRHRMKLSERWEWIKILKRKWEAHPGVQMVRIGYEQYGLTDDLGAFEAFMLQERNYFPIEELGSPDTGKKSKNDRIDRLEPEIRNGRFLFPAVVWQPDVPGNDDHLCYWSVWRQEEADALERNGETTNLKVGEIYYRPVKGKTRRQQAVAEHRIVTALKRRDENNNIYDLTRVFIDEAIRHPFAPHDDFIDAASRIFDIQPVAPVVYDSIQSTESLDTIDSSEIALAAQAEAYDIMSDENAVGSAVWGKRF